MSEVTWYSRFAIWVGAIVLLVQAVAGRGAGFMSLISVILMAGGLAGFLFGLVWDERVPRSMHQEAATVSNLEVPEKPDLPEEVVAAERADNFSVSPATETASREEVERPSSPAAEPEAPVHADTAPRPGATETASGEEVESASWPGAEPEARVHADTAPRPGATGNRVETEEIAMGSVLIGRPCIRCGQPLLLDQMAATCPVCRNPQHAGCWIENHFRCSTPGCAGRGSLEAPKTSGDE